MGFIYAETDLRAGDTVETADGKDLEISSFDDGLVVFRHSSPDYPLYPLSYIKRAYRGGDLLHPGADGGTKASRTWCCLCGVMCTWPHNCERRCRARTSKKTSGSKSARHVIWADPRRRQKRSARGGRPEKWPSR